jgi:cell division protein FtsX
VAVAFAAGIAAWASLELQALTNSYALEFKVVFPGLLEWLGVVAAAAALGLAGAWVAVGQELRRFAVR